MHYIIEFRRTAALQVISDPPCFGNRDRCGIVEMTRTSKATSPMARVSLRIAAHEVFKALGDDARIRIVRLLAMTDEPFSVTKLQETLDQPLSTVSKHLKELRVVGLTEFSARGRFHYFRRGSGDVFINAVMAAVLTLDDQQFDDDLRAAGFPELARRLHSEEIGD